MKKNLFLTIAATLGLTAVAIVQNFQFYVINTRYIKRLFICLWLVSSFYGMSQSFPNPATLSTGQGVIGTLDPIWQVSPWYSSAPPNPIGLTYSPALIAANCAPGGWVDPASLPAPVNNGNWISGNDANCLNNIDGYRYFRLTLNLPADCNGNNVAVSGNYILYLAGYVDNQITNVFVNGTPLGISGGSFSSGAQLDMTIPGPWIPGINYVDIQFYNAPAGGGNNPYGILIVANSNASANTDTDGDGISDINDLCPCQASFENNSSQLNSIFVYAGIDQSICSGDQVTVTATGAQNYSWNNGIVDGVPFTPTNTSDYIVTADSSGCYSSDTLSIIVNQPTNSTLIETGLDSVSVNGIWYNQNGQYTQVIPNAAGCDSTITINVSLSFTGISELSGQSFSIFPNPATSIIQVKADAELLGMSYSIYDNRGKVVLRGKLNAENTSISLNNLSDGIYMLSIGENMKHTFKVIKE
jgi:hypothetical protein